MTSSRRSRISTRNKGWKAAAYPANGTSAQGMEGPMADQTWTLGTLLDWTAKHLAQKGVEYPRLDAEVLLAHAAGCKRIDLYGMRYAEVAAAEVRQRYRELIAKRLEGCPVASLVGRKEFYGLELAVSPAV